VVWTSLSGDRRSELYSRTQIRPRHAILTLYKNPDVSYAFGRTRYPTSNSNVLNILPHRTLWHLNRPAQGKRLEKKRRFREAQWWCTGCEGRISLLKRRHGLNRCRYRGPPGIKRWVGSGVIADNLINIG